MLINGAIKDIPFVKMGGSNPKNGFIAFKGFKKGGA
jgi:hypothetical protein